MEARDVNGKVLNIGDTIVVGHNNGSTLEVAKIYKITAKKIWYTIDESFPGCRDHNRVSKVD